MARKMLSIEFGERLVKIGVFSPKGKINHIDEGFTIDLPKGIIVDGHIEDKDRLFRLIAKELEIRDLKSIKTATFIVTASKIVSREVTFPKMNEKKLKEVINLNANEYFPVDLVGYHVAHQVIEKEVGEDKSQRVLITIAPKKMFEEYYDIAKGFNLVLTAIDHSSNSQLQALSALKKDGLAMFVNVGIRGTVVTFIQDGILMLQRSFPFGGDELLSQVGDEDEDIVKTIEKAKDAKWLGEKIESSSMNVVMSRLVSGIARSADFFKSTYKGASANEIILTGECGEVAGLKEAIEREMGLSVTPLKSIQGIDRIQGSTTDINFFLNCVGSQIAPINLLPEELLARTKENRARANSMNFPALIFTICVVAAGGISAYAYMGYNSAQKELEKIEQRITELQPVLETYNLYTGYVTMQENMELIEVGQNLPNSRISTFIEEMEVKMPTSFVASTMSFDNVGVSFSVRTSSLEDAAVAISNLHNFESIEIVQVSEVTGVENELGIVVAEFSINAIYAVEVVEEEVVEEAPAGDVPTL